MLQFEGVLHRPEGTGTWTYVKVPFTVEEVFGSKAQVKVKGTVNGVPYRSSLMPAGDGTHYMVVKQALREDAGVTAGDSVRLTMEADTEARTVEIPDDLAAALDEHREAGERFDRLAYSHRKEYVDWIESAKKPETRSNRIAKSIAMLAEGKRLKG
ncbi:YdeI/OmpD-associated family protein [Paenibacillus filicis]|uniref:YdeI/OmpD-associated family protein n=1 Tax=Paenibacillus gyeongsangnamensis TaxID=3388067 RepID=A0ABT4QFS2_9BACL|nr:YdeI/OmpD-associated family protein [Paenibacillus filicis]MCZ8515702.1 YdeI/OmpD-associated family protein [Paenibacillus filicis]